jgi:hypothetical protein
MDYWEFFFVSDVKFTLVMIGTDCTGSCKSNYHTIKAMTAPKLYIYTFYNYNQFMEMFHFLNP